MRLLQRKDIDVQLWDEKISNSSLQNPFIFSWALDATASDWCAIVNDDYSFLIPLPLDNKFGLKRARQHYFSRQLDWIGSEDELRQAFNFAKEHFHEMDFGLSPISTLEKTKRFQSLKYSEEIEYSKNTKRILKKEKFQVKEKESLETFLEIYRENAFQKFEQPIENLDRLKRFVLALFEHNLAKMFIIEENNDMKAGAIFIDYKSTRTYLIGDCTTEFKKEGAMFYLLDHGIQNASENTRTFDFGGSNVESVANFYKKLGGKDHFYSHVHWENHPIWYSLVKRFRK